MIIEFNWRLKPATSRYDSLPGTFVCTGNCYHEKITNMWHSNNRVSVFFRILFLRYCKSTPLRWTFLLYTSSLLFSNSIMWQRNWRHHQESGKLELWHFPIHIWFTITLGCKKSIMMDMILPDRTTDYQTPDSASTLFETSQEKGVFLEMQRRIKITWTVFTLPPNLNTASESGAIEQTKTAFMIHLDVQMFGIAPPSFPVSP